MNQRIAEATLPFTPYEPSAQHLTRVWLLVSSSVLTWLQADSRDFAANGGAASADDYSSVTYRWDEDFLNEKYEMLTLKVIHRRQRTGFEESKDIAIHVNDLIAGRYQVNTIAAGVACTRLANLQIWIYSR